MKLPKLNSITFNRCATYDFLGMDTRTVINQKQFNDLNNITNDKYPMLSVRKGTYSSPIDNVVNSIRYTYKTQYNGQVVYVYNHQLYINHILVENSPSLATGSERATRENVVVMGANICFFPANYMYNTVTGEWTRLDNFVNAIQSNPMRFSYCDANGDGLNISVYGNTIPTQQYTSEGAYWLDTSTSPNTLRRYSSTSGEWEKVDTSYIKCNFHTPSIKYSDYFKEGDGIKFQGITESSCEKINGIYVINKILDDGAMIIPSTATLDSNASSFTGQCIRVIPRMDYIICSQNRLWGCRFGIAEQGYVGTFVNQIYACELGNPCNWVGYDSTNMSPYYADIGDGGEFTGAIEYNGYPTFFKENAVIKVYGNYPSAYQVSSSAIDGVKSGSNRSLDIINGVLYYASNNGVMAYNGTSASCISDPINDEIKGKNLLGCRCHEKYLCIVNDNIKNNSLFVYDTTRGTWVRHGTLNKNRVCHLGNLDNNGAWVLESNLTDDGGRFLYIESDKTANEQGFDWTVESGKISVDKLTISNRNYSSFVNKYISRMDITMSLAIDSNVTIFIKYDNGEYTQVANIIGQNTKCFSLPIRLNRCQYYSYKIVGRGYCDIINVSHNVVYGGENNGI